MIGRTLALLLAAAAALPGPARGEEGAVPAPPSAAPPGSPPPPQVPPGDPAAMEKLQAQVRKMQLQRMEALKESDPEAYAEQKRAMERQQKISQILADVRSAKLTDAEAERKLFPLMKEVMKPELDRMEEQIELLETRLAALKKARKDPDEFVRLRIEEMLGKRAPDRGGPGMAPVTPP